MITTSGFTTNGDMVVSLPFVSVILIAYEVAREKSIEKLPSLWLVDGAKKPDNGIMDISQIGVAPASYIQASFAESIAA